MSSTAITWIIIGLIVLFVLWIIMIYNGLVALRQRVNQAFSDIDVQTKQRHDLIPNLVETVKGYAAHERGTLEAVVQARNAAVTAQAGGVAAQAAAENVLSGALRQLFALSEAYPDLKANQNFQQLQSRAVRYRKQDRRGAPLLQQRGAGVQHRYPAVPRRADGRGTWIHAKRILRRRSRRAQGARTGAAGEVLTFRSRVPEPVQRTTLAERFTAGPPQTETITGPQRTVACPALALCRARDTRI